MKAKSFELFDAKTLPALPIDPVSETTEDDIISSPVEPGYEPQDDDVKWEYIDATQEIIAYRYDGATASWIQLQVYIPA